MFATNACPTALDGRSRRALPSGLGPASDDPDAELLPAWTADAVMEMPPVPLWYRGSHDYGRFLHRVFRMRGTDWRMRHLTANGLPALAAYAAEPDGGHHLHTLQVFTVVDGRYRPQCRLRGSRGVGPVRTARANRLRIVSTTAMSRGDSGGRYQ